MYNLESCLKAHTCKWRGTGGQETWRKGDGRLQEMGGEGTGSRISKVTGSGRKRGKIMQHCAIFHNKKKMQTGGSQLIQGQEPRL